MALINPQTQVNIGYCTTCKTSCPTPKVRSNPNGNCSHWTDGKAIAEVDEHGFCDCGELMTIDNGRKPLKCEACEKQAVNMTKEMEEEG